MTSISQDIQVTCLSSATFAGSWVPAFLRGWEPSLLVGFRAPRKAQSHPEFAEEAKRMPVVADPSVPRHWAVHSHAPISFLFRRRPARWVTPMWPWRQQSPEMRSEQPRVMQLVATSGCGPLGWLPDRAPNRVGLQAAPGLGACRVGQVAHLHPPTLHGGPLRGLLRPRPPRGSCAQSLSLFGGSSVALASLPALDLKQEMRAAARTF